MENQEEKKPEEKKQGNVSEADREYLRKAEEELPDANKFVENTDALIAGVDPQKDSENEPDESEKK